MTLQLRDLNVPKTLLEAEGLLSNMKQLEFGILQEVGLHVHKRSSLRERFSATSSALQIHDWVNGAIPMLVSRRISSSLDEISLMNMKNVDTINEIGNFWL